MLGKDSQIRQSARPFVIKKYIYSITIGLVGVQTNNGRSLIVRPSSAARRLAKIIIGGRFPSSIHRHKRVEGPPSIVK